MTAVPPSSLLLICLILQGCTPDAEQPMTDTENLWLEEIQAPRALDWVGERNAESLAKLQDDERYEALNASAVEIYTSDDRIPYVTHVEGHVHNFWQDASHIKGIWRRASLASYLDDRPDWETLLDIDALAATEGEDWVYKGRTCLGPSRDRCLVHLSRGGSDAVQIREFDVPARSFVDEGFVLAEAKTRVDWLDADHLLVATDFGPGTLTTSGYPRLIKKWRRGSPLDEAELLFTAEETDMVVAPTTIHRPEGAYTFVVRMPDFFSEDIYFLSPSGELQKVPVPGDVDFKGMFHSRFVAELRSDWVTPAQTFVAGSLIAIDLLASLAQNKPVNVETVLAPAEDRAIKGVSLGGDAIYVSLMEHVNGVLLKIIPAEAGWAATPLEFPAHGSIDVVTNDALGDVLMVNYESFLAPSSLYLVEKDTKPRAIKTLAARFAADQYVSEQHFAVSADGTRVPYYVVAAKDLVRDGTAPAYIYAYGGFEVSLTPGYPSALGIEWLKAGGVLVQANLRGGGEYGPAWHQAALKENRRRAFDDLVAVSEDLVRRKITSPARLAIRGGSNGGLLVTAVMTQRPELFGAVVCAVPLIDMLRYHKLSAGASWMAEYGNPDIAEEAAYIAQYSPLQNVDAGADYPPAFFWTNTKDDRVHPSHARRMVAKMQSQEHDVLYYENTEGGHGGGADPLALAHTTALELVFMLQTLGVEVGVEVGVEAEVP